VKKYCEGKVWKASGILKKWINKIKLINLFGEIDLELVTL